MFRVMSAIGVLTILFATALSRGSAASDWTSARIDARQVGILDLQILNGYRALGVDRDLSQDVAHNFASGADGAFPLAALIGDSTGALYGTTNGGGTYGLGTVFRLVPSQNGYRGHVLYSFQGNADGSSPDAPLLGDSNGLLYGTTVTGGGGTFGYGTVFALVPIRNGYREKVLYRFQGGADGAGPQGSVIGDRSGDLFGTTYAGGRFGVGTVFQLTPGRSGYTESVPYSFQQNGADGENPTASLLMDQNGALYGTTANGGTFGQGAVFKVIPGNIHAEKVLYSFQPPADGANPYASLIEDGSGALYGTTLRYGGQGKGMVFKLSPVRDGVTAFEAFAYSESIVHAFTGYGDGKFPHAALIADNSGSLYGTTVDTVFKLTPNGGGFDYRILHRFRGSADGNTIWSSLFVDGSGALYGTTEFGGIVNHGTVFKLTPTGDRYTYTLLHTFR